MHDNTFSRYERLKSRKMIGRLFKEGQAFLAFPLRVVWLPFEVEGDYARQKPGDPVPPVQVAIAIPKRTFKTAVERNRLKRQVREAYRLHKAALYEKLTARSAADEPAGPRPPIALMLMYVGKEALPFSEIEAGVKKMLRKM